MYMHHAYQAFCRPLRNAQLMVGCSWVRELYALAYETIDGWQQEMNLYQSLLLAVFATIQVLYTIAYTPLQSLLESQLYS